MSAYSNGRQAIVVKFLPCTDTKGSRMKATAQASSVTVGYDYAAGTSANYRQACDALLAKLGWDGKWIGSQMANGDYAFVQVQAND